MEKKMRRLSKSITEKNVVACSNIATITNYTPVKEESSKEMLKLHLDQMLDAKRMEADAEVKWKAQRASAIEAEWQLHTTMQACKAYVVSQFGPDSNEAESIGLKKKSEYKKPKRKKTPPPDKA
ncbi:MAG: hypothetical protein HOP30_03700 [Cyclobacteriaceae bacterium]|nr:hypothetical protein [Cyclobacteriaceae bacterium]